MITRREFVAAAGVGALGGAPGLSGAGRPAPRDRDPWAGAQAAADRLDPWIELDARAFQSNLEFLAARTERPILAVVKCNGYGLDHRIVGPLLDSAPEVWGFAVVTAEEAVQLRDSGVRKPVLLMGDFTRSAEPELAERDITLAVYTVDAPGRPEAMARRTGKAINVHLYIDTGFHRLGMDYREAEPWVEALARSNAVAITGTMTELTQSHDFDKEQIARFTEFTRAIRRKGIELGPLHASASDGIINHPEGRFDMIRPGNLLYGVPASAADDDEAASVQVVYRMKTRVIRVVQLQKGETLGYDQAFAPDRETDVAIIKCGRTDGYVYRTLGRGSHALINGYPYPLVSAINSSHCYADLGKNHGVERLDVVTMIGPEKGIRPQDLAAMNQGLGRYEGFNLSARVPRYVV
jgi:alanine racemase